QYAVRIDHVQPVWAQGQAMGEHPAPNAAVRVVLRPLEPQATIQARNLSIALAGKVLTDQLGGAHGPCTLCQRMDEQGFGATTDHAAAQEQRVYERRLFSPSQDGAA